ncbi:ParB/RepB/Spo0J family partition protein, partial [Streptomyces sp. SID5785]
VRQVGPESFELIMGERRWRASREAELERIPAIVRATDDEKLLLDALLENLHRAQLNPLEEAKAYEQLLTDFNCTHDQLADRIGRSRPQVSNTLRLLKLSPAVQKRVAAGVLSAGHARALLGVEDSEEQDRLALRIVAEGLSVRAVEEIVTLMGSHSKAAPRAKGPRTGTLVSPGLNRLATRLSDRFDTRVKVDMGQKKGKIIVEFADLGDLRRIMGTLAPDEESLLQEGLPETDEADGES